MDMVNENFTHRAKCEICGSGKEEILISWDFVDARVLGFLDRYYGGRIEKDILSGAKYEIAKCCDCGFVWQTNILTDKLMFELYENWINAQDSLKKKEDNWEKLNKLYKREIKGVVSVFLKKEKLCEIKILDFGMGWGFWCFSAKELDFDVTGFELSQVRADFAKGKNIRVVNNLNGKKFDFINAEQVLEHINNPVETLQELFNKMNSGGILKIGVPNGKGIAEKLKKENWRAQKDAVHPLEHINCFTRKNLIKAGERTGFGVAKLTFLEFFKKPIIWTKLFLKQKTGVSLIFRKK